MIGHQVDHDRFKASEIRDWEKSDTERKREGSAVIERNKSIEKEEEDAPQGGGADGEGDFDEDENDID